MWNESEFYMELWIEITVQGSASAKKKGKSWRTVSSIFERLYEWGMFNNTHSNLVEVGSSEAILFG